MHSLTLLMLMPVLGAAIIAVLPQRSSTLIRTTALLTATVTLIYAVSFLLVFDFTSGSLQFAKNIPWNTRLGTSYAVGIDGISLAMILLATLLSFIAILTSLYSLK